MMSSTGERIINRHIVTTMSMIRLTAGVSLGNNLLGINNKIVPKKRHDTSQLKNKSTEKQEIDKVASSCGGGGEVVSQPKASLLCVQGFLGRVIKIDKLLF
jgi:hypothetical protein